MSEQLACFGVSYSVLLDNEVDGCNSEADADSAVQLSCYSYHCSSH
uniref:Uncharacterized protein n=1 Tax=Arundo donax TaxID=35708 RepID=A0A0A9EVG0_ARUDO